MAAAAAAAAASSSSSSKKTFDFDSYSSGAHVPEDKDQFLVQTPYGTGMVIRTRRNNKRNQVTMRELELIDWNRSTSTSKVGPHPLRRPAILYSPTDFASIPPKLHDEVVCALGRGTVTEIRRRDDDDDDDDDTTTTTIVVVLSSWRLAGRSRVTCYLSPSSVRVVRPKKLYEMNVYERVEYAQELKAQAGRQFALKEYQQALELYLQATEAVRYVQHKTDSSNEVRADLVVLMITCYNNAGMCCSQLNNLWDDTARHASSALILIEALEEKKGMKIHTLLNREGLADVKLFGEWKVKALLLKARACMERKVDDTAQAMELLKQAHGVLVEFNKSSSPLLLSMDKEVKKLNATCKERRKQERKREKKQALKMFGAAADDFAEEKKERSTPESSPPSSPIEVATGGVAMPASFTVVNGDDHPDTIPEQQPTTNAFDSASTPAQKNRDRERFQQLAANNNKKRVSFSDQVTEKLYEPDLGSVVAAEKAEEDESVMMRLDVWMPPLVVLAACGVVLGTVLTAVGLHVLHGGSTSTRKKCI